MRLDRAAIVIASLAMLTGCATNFEPKPLPPDHPASAQAQEAPRSGMRRLLASDPLIRKSKSQLARKGVPDPDFPAGSMSHDMGSMPGMDMSKPAAGSPPAQPQTTPGMDAAQMQNMTPAPVAGPPKTSPAATIYTCVMHPEVQQPGPGNCPKCGMTLVKKESPKP